MKRQLIAPHDRVKYMNVGFTIFQEYTIVGCCVEQDGIEVTCDVTDENDIASLKNYCWTYNGDYDPVWRFEVHQ
jgi:hypothetical protein